MEPATLQSLKIAALALLAVAYFVIAIFRAAFAELNPMAATRLLGARGLGARDGESPGDLLGAIRTTFDLAHHLVLVTAATLAFSWFAAAGSASPFLTGGAAAAGGVIVIQSLARLIALSSPERTFSATLAVVAIAYQGLRPVIAPAAWVIHRLRRSGRDRRAAAGEDEATDEEIEAFIDAGRKEGILEAEESNLIRQVVEFHDSVVREVMTPRTEIVALPKGATIAEARALFAKERHSRLPIFRDHLDQIEGIVVMKDLVARWGQIPEDAPVESIMLPPYFVPETKQVSELLREFQSRRLQLAIVVDEYGGTEGLVTIEDLLEELVGDIQEEHEREEAPFVRQGDDTFIALGSANIEDLSQAIGVEIEPEGFETVAGMVYSVLGRIPREGEAVEANGLRIEIVKADKRRINRVRVSRMARTGTP